MASCSDYGGRLSTAAWARNRPTSSLRSSNHALCRELEKQPLLERRFTRKREKLLKKSIRRKMAVGTRAMLPESLLVHFPEAGALRDLAFSVIGAGSAMALSAAAAWAWQREEHGVRWPSPFKFSTV